MNTLSTTENPNDALRLHVQWKPLNVITFGPGIFDYTNRIITITNDFYLVKLCKYAADNTNSDNIKRLSLLKVCFYKL